VSIKRFSFNETTDWHNCIGFQVRVSLRFRSLDTTIIIQKGSLVYGFNNGSETYGYLLNNDEALGIPSTTGNYYITMDAQGIFRLELGTYSSVRGIGAAIPGVPWYTYNNRALVGKIFRKATIITGYIVCDDPYWCEFEGAF
jgi:hypothetical protein